jgi:hypothetical protein
MALTLRVLAQAVARGEPAALVDAVDALEPGDLVPEARPRVLWVRPTDLLGALKSADVLLDAGGFSLVALYLVGFGSAGVPRAPVPSSAWVRLGQRAAQARTTLLVVTDGVAQCSPGAFAAVTLDARRERAVWVGARLLDAVEGEVRVVRSRASPVGRVMVR